MTGVHFLERLTIEHRGALQQLETIRETAESLAKTGYSETAFQRLLNAVNFIDIDIRRHNQQEEDFLFPLLDKVLPPQGPTSVMRSEHQQLYAGYSKLQALIEAVARSRDDETARGELLKAAEFIVTLLTNHIYKEDHILFPMAERMLTDEQWESIAVAMENAQRKES